MISDEKVALCILLKMYPAEYVGDLWCADSNRVGHKGNGDTNIVTTARGEVTVGTGGACDNNDN